MAKEKPMRVPHVHRLAKIRRRLLQFEIIGNLPRPAAGKLELRLRGVNARPGPSRGRIIRERAEIAPVRLGHVEGGVHGSHLRGNLSFAEIARRA